MSIRKTIEQVLEDLEEPASLAVPIAGTAALAALGGKRAMKALAKRSSKGSRRLAEGFGASVGGGLGGASGAMYVREGRRKK